MFISLRPSTNYGVKCQPGVIWGHRGQKVMFSKNATSDTEFMALSQLCNIVYPCYSYTCISLKPFIAFMGSRSTCGVISAGRVCRLCRQPCLVWLVMTLWKSVDKLNHKHYCKTPVPWVDETAFNRKWAQKSG